MPNQNPKIADPILKRQFIPYRMASDDGRSAVASSSYRICLFPSRERSWSQTAERKVFLEASFRGDKTRVSKN